MGGLRNLGVDRTSISGTLPRSMSELELNPTTTHHPPTPPPATHTYSEFLTSVSCCLPSLRRFELERLRMLQHDHSPISGTLPPAWDGLRRLEWWELELTPMSGTLPTELYQALSSLPFRPPPSSPFSPSSTPPSSPLS